MTLNLPKTRVLVNFSQFLDDAHISTLKCDEMAGVRPRQPLYEIFSIKRRFQQSKFQSPRFMEPGASGRQRRLPLLKSGYFTAIIWCTVKSWDGATSGRRHAPGLTTQLFSTNYSLCR